MSQNTQNIENILDNLTNQYAGQLAQANQQVAILLEENRALREEIKTLKDKLTDDRH